VTVISVTAFTACIYDVNIYLFVPQAKVMFDGEFASLDALCNTSTVRVPKPMKVRHLILLLSPSKIKP